MTYGKKYLEKKYNTSLNELKKFPKYFLIETINTCNARCIMCGIDFDKKRTQLMTDSLFKKILDEISENVDYVEKVQIYYDCEPLIDKKLHLKIKDLKNIGVKTTNIATNASILFPKRSQELIEANLDEIYITIDSMKKEIFELIRLRLNFDEVLKNTLDFIKIRNKLNSKLNIRLQMISLKENLGEEKYFQDYWKKKLNTNDDIVIHKEHNWGKVIDDRKLIGDANINDIPCSTLWSNFCIHVNGSVGMCSVDTIQGSENSLGNLNNKTIKEIWNDDKVEKMREMHLNGKRSNHKLCDGCSTWRPDMNFSKIKGLN